MKFRDFDVKMRAYETAYDHCVLPGIYIVARLDGRNFTRLTKMYNFEHPFDERFRDYMINTVCHLMDCGFNVLYGYTQSDEISLLFNLNENTFNRKIRKYNSILAGEASAKFSAMLELSDSMGVFDCRICQLPSIETVLDYFRWRQEDAHRNALNSCCYWLLRSKGQSAIEATNTLKGKSVADKNELLFLTGGINFNEIPVWQKRGVGLYWEYSNHQGIDRETGAVINFKRKHIKIDFELPMPMKDNYSFYIDKIIGKPPFVLDEEK